MLPVFVQLWIAGELESKAGIALRTRDKLRFYLSHLSRSHPDKIVRHHVYALIFRREIP